MVQEHCYLCKTLTRLVSDFIFVHGSKGQSDETQILLSNAYHLMWCKGTIAYVRHFGDLFLILFLLMDQRLSGVRHRL